MATLVVKTAADVVDGDDGRLSLREAVAAANVSQAADTIRFLAALTGDGATFPDHPADALEIEAAGGASKMAGSPISG